MNIKHYKTLFRVAMLMLVAGLFFTGNAVAAVLIAPLAGADLEEIAQSMKNSSLAFDAARKEVKEGHEELTRKMGEQGTKINLELKEAIDKVLGDFNTKFSGIQTALADVEQKAIAARDSQPSEAKSWGEQFVESTNFKSGIGENGSGFTGTCRAEVKQVNSAAAGGLILRPYRDNEVVNLLRERRVVRDLLRTIAVNTSSVDYVKQTTRTNNAGPVEEGTSKPYSDYAWSDATAVIRTLAHLTKITRQAMDDAPRLIGEIDAEMRYGLGFVEERQFLYGSGVGQNLHGIMPQATAYVLPAGFTRRAGTTKVDALRVAMLQNAMAMLPADGIVLHDVDWADIELTKTSDGAYLFSNPQGTVSQRMWNLPVVSTPAMTPGDFLVGNFLMGATVYDRMGVEVLISTENVDDFETNRATMRAEERVGIAVKRPEAFTKGTFTAAIAAINPA
jgi:HK97 family phage major capsid protein